MALPYFLATKIEAFYGRGADDPRFSHDLEDIVITLVNVSKIEIMSGASQELKDFLQSTFLKFLNDSSIMEAISGHNPYPEFEDYFDKIVDNLKL